MPCGFSTILFSASTLRMLVSYSSGVTVRVTFVPDRFKRSSRTLVKRSRSALATSKPAILAFSSAAWILARVRSSLLRIAVRTMFWGVNRSSVLVSSLDVSWPALGSSLRTSVDTGAADTASSLVSATPVVSTGLPLMFSNVRGFVSVG